LSLIFGHQDLVLGLLPAMESLKMVKANFGTILYKMNNFKDSVVEMERIFVKLVLIK
jgi:hypothetical protein